MQIAKKIFLVEDDKTLSFIIKQKIKSNNFEIRCFNTVNETKKAILEEIDSVSVLISDNNLPDGYGMELLDLIRNELKSDLKFIMISASNSLFMQELFYQKKGDFFFSKPFVIDNLVEKCLE